MKTLSALLLLVTFGLQAAPVYKHVDEQGNVTYSDKPQDEHDQPADLKPISVIPGRKVSSPPRRPDPAPEPPPRVRYSFEWKHPVPEQTLRNTGGTVKVDLRISPSPPEGYRVELWLDGNKRMDWPGVPVTLQEVWRGEHVLEARIVDTAGRKVAAGQVKFYMHQTSLLIPTPIGRGG